MDLSTASGEGHAAMGALRLRRPIKVAQLLYSGLGGHGSVAFSLARASRECEAWDSHMVFVGIEPLLPEYERMCSSQQIGRQHVRTIEGRAWTAWTQVYRALEAARPEAIVLHSVKTILPCWLYARRNRIPLVAVEHQPNGLKKRSEWVVSRLLMALADRVVLLTEEYRHELRAALAHHWREDKVQVIPNGIDTEAFAPGPRPGGISGLHIGMAARFSSTKRQEILVDALRLLRERDGPGRWHLSLAGDGDKLATVRGGVELGLQDMVSFPGYLGEGALREWFGGLDVYAHASDGETLSTSLLQAMAMGLPIVGSDVQGISNLLAGGVGMVVPQSPAAFAEAFSRLAAEPALARHLAERARGQAVSVYSQASMFRSYHGMLGQLGIRTQ